MRIGRGSLGEESVRILQGKAARQPLSGWTQDLFGLLGFLVPGSVLVFDHLSRASKYLDVGGDGFIYLSMAKYGFLDPIRTPLIGWLLSPEISSVRLQFGAIHILNSVLTFLLARHLLKNRLYAALAGFLYLFNWWFVQITIQVITDPISLLFLLLGVYIQLRWRGRVFSAALSGTCIGMAFLLKPYFGLAFPVLIYVLRRDARRLVVFATFFLAFSTAFELAIDYLRFGTLLYTPWEFFRINILQALPTKIYSGRGMDYFFWRLWTNPLFDSMFRWIFTPLYPFMTIAAAWLVKSALRRTRQTYGVLLTGLIILSFSGLNIVRVNELTYPDLPLDRIDYPDTWSVASNLPTAVRYFNGRNAFHIFDRGGYLDMDLDTFSEISGRHLYTILFPHDLEPAFLDRLLDSADRDLILLPERSLNGTAKVYLNPRYPVNLVDGDFRSGVLPEGWTVEESASGLAGYDEGGAWLLLQPQSPDGISRLSYNLRHLRAGGLNMTFRMIFGSADTYQAIEILGEELDLRVMKDAIFLDGRLMATYDPLDKRWNEIRLELFANSREVLVQINGQNFVIPLGRGVQEGDEVSIIQMTVKGPYTSRSRPLVVRSVAGYLTPSPSSPPEP